MAPEPVGERERIGRGAGVGGGRVGRARRAGASGGRVGRARGGRVGRARGRASALAPASAHGLLNHCNHMR